MEAVGIICEYNPFHAGHKKQFAAIKSEYPHSGIVCLMSGNYVQRGAPAIIDKSIRAEVAVRCGADLVLELPITAALSSAEGFAGEGVRILGSFCNRLCFGTESGDADALLATARGLLSPAFPEYLRLELDKGVSFPVARQQALRQMGLKQDTLSCPNDILATEYCKAILSQKLSMKPMPIAREGSYHGTVADTENPSATAVRNCMLSGKLWQDYVPDGARELFSCAPLHDLSHGEQAILCRLRTMTDEDYEQLPYGSEGLWRKLMHNARTLPTLEEIITATKSKRYTRTRLDRMILCAFLGITRQDIETPAPYARVLALNDTGRVLLKTARKAGQFPNAGEHVDMPYQMLEHRANRLYSLFSVNGKELPYDEKTRRVFYLSGETEEK